MRSYSENMLPLLMELPHISSLKWQMENGNYFENTFIIYRLWVTIIPRLLCVFKKHYMSWKKNEVLVNGAIFSSNFTVDIKYVRFDLLLFSSNSVRFLSSANRHNNRHIHYVYIGQSQWIRIEHKISSFHKFLTSFLTKCRQFIYKGYIVSSLPSHHNRKCIEF